MESQQKISFSYEPREDRLNIICRNTDESATAIILTRQLLKSLLQALPQWLQGEEQHQQSQQFEHHSAQESLQTTEESIQCELKKYWLADKINLTRMEQHIQLSFAQDAGSEQLSMTISEIELHKIIGTILQQVSNWDLQNPWEEKKVQHSVDLAATFKNYH